jgi:pimeloyl-ACP methyl ester carboxylesterase
MNLKPKQSATVKNLLVPLLFLILFACKPSTNNPVPYGSNSKAGKYVDVNDIRVYYETYGEGEPLLLFHGNGGSIKDFICQIPELSKHFKVIAVDSRAQGRTTDSDQEITYALMASDMSELIDKLNLGKVNVVGWSDGGNIGLELAFAHPEKVLKVITFGANYTWENCEAKPDSVVMDPHDPLIIQTSDLIKRNRAANGNLSIDPQRIPLINKKLKVLMEKYPNFTPDQLKTIQVPFMIVAGDHDLISLDQTISLFTNLPKAQLFIVPHSSHISLIEYPELINSEIVRFLKAPYSDIDRFYFCK